MKKQCSADKKVETKVESDQTAADSTQRTPVHCQRALQL